MSGAQQWRFVSIDELRLHVWLGTIIDGNARTRAPWIRFEPPYRTWLLDVPAFIEAAPWSPWFDDVVDTQAKKLNGSEAVSIVGAADCWDWAADAAVPLGSAVTRRLLDGPLEWIQSASGELAMVGSPHGLLVEVGESARAGAMLAVTGRISVGFVFNTNVSAYRLRQAMTVFSDIEDPADSTSIRRSTQRNVLLALDRPVLVDQTDAST